MIGRTTLALACVLLGTVAELATCEATAGPMLTAGSDNAQVGEIFTVPISIANAEGLTSFQFNLAFNPTSLQVISFTDVGTDFEAAAIAGGDALTGITGFIDNSTGLLSGVADSFGLFGGSGLTPGGTLVDVEFQALAPGISPLTLANAVLIDNGVPLFGPSGDFVGDFVLQNGEVTVGEPGSLVLLCSALAGLAALRRYGRPS